MAAHRLRTRSSTPTDVSCLEEGQQGGAGFGLGAMADAGHPRRKIGRPIAYTGDPDAQHLTEPERRRIKRQALGALHSGGAMPRDAARLCCLSTVASWRCGAAPWTASLQQGATEALPWWCAPESAVCLMCRRIANRESARRVRRKRQNALEDMQVLGTCSRSHRI